MKHNIYRKLIKGNNGSFTVEASIIVPVVIITVLALIMIGEFLYQRSCVQSVADRAAHRGAEVWNAPAKDMFCAQITKDKMRDVSLYWRARRFGLDSAEGKKKSKIEEYTEYMITRVSVLGRPVKLNVTADMAEDYIVYKKIRVVVEADYKNPFASALKVFGLKNTITIRAHSYAVVNEPVEFIRTTDFAVDVVKEIDNNVFKGNGDEVITNVRDGIGNIFSKLEDFMKSKPREK